MREVKEDGRVKRIRTVEYVKGEGWLARSPYDGRQLGGDGFVWRTRDVARTVVDECKLFERPAALSASKVQR